MNQSNFNNLITLAVSTLVSLIILEFALSILDIPPRKPIRYLFLSQPNLKDQVTSFGFYPNVVVREVSVYSGKNNFHLEYDYLFQTNNIGLIQKYPTIQGKKSIVLIGNSFTQGEGAVPWFYQTEQDWRNDSCQLVNLGVMGTGVQQWFDTLQWFSTIGQIQHIYMIFISGDWIRERWIAETDSNLHLIPVVDASQSRNTTKSTLIYLIERSSDQKSLLTKAAQLNHSAINKSAIHYESLYLYRSMEQLRVWLGTMRRKIFGLEKIKIGENDRRRFTKNEESFKDIIKTYGENNITAIHIPTREEVINKKYDYVGQLAGEVITSHQVIYQDGLKICGLREDDFYKYDGHPNASGYIKIRRFVENLLKKQAPGAGSETGTPARANCR